jgi:hypothetical protein
MKSGRIQREKKTVNKMITLYCRYQHSSKALCNDCRELIDYSDARLDHCRFGKDKPVCANCSVHCYKPEMREKIQEVMRFSGPRMIMRHPCLAIMHIIDKKI